MKKTGTRTAQPPITPTPPQGTRPAKVSGNPASTASLLKWMAKNLPPESAQDQFEPGLLDEPKAKP